MAGQCNTKGSRRVCAGLYLGVIMSVVGAASTARADDATQSLRSPLSPGTGATLEAAADKTSLRLGLLQQEKSGLAWQFALEAALESEQETAALFSSGTGVSPGVLAKASVGYSEGLGGDDTKYVGQCTAFKDAVKKQIEANRQVKCFKALGELGVTLGITFQAQPGVTCADATKAFVALPAVTSTLSGLDPVARKALEALIHEALPQDSKDRVVSSRSATLSGALRGDSAEKKKQKVEKFLSCEAWYQRLATRHPELTKNQRDSLRRTYEDTVRAAEDTVRLKLFASGFITYTQRDFIPVGADSQVQFGSEETWRTGLPGGSIDLSLFTGPLRIGVQAGYERIDANTAREVCETTTDGDFSIRDCGRFVVGQPRSSNSTFGTMVVGINPIPYEVLGLHPGVQLGLRVATSERVQEDGDEVELFDEDSWGFTTTLPVFLADADAPWGLRAGFAPQWIQDAANGSSFRLLLFVGSSFDPSADDP